MSSSQISKYEGLMEAAGEGNIRNVQKFISEGANVNAILEDGTTPLLLAAYDGYFEIVNALIEARADVNKANRYEETPLFVASQNGHINVVKRLIAAGANVNKDRESLTPLFIASQVGHLKIIEELISAGADINKESDKGVTPLNIASDMHQLNIVRALLTAGARLNDMSLRHARYNIYSPKEINELILSYEHRNTEPVEETILPTMNNPTNAPLKCFDPLMASETNISVADNAVFYIQNSDGKIISAGCLDEDTLSRYKSEPSYIFYKCKDSVPVSSFHITRDSVHPKKYRLLNFAMRIYVLDAEAQQLKIGNTYVLKPTELLGRIASKSVVDGGSIVSALHCGPADGSFLYSIHKVGASGGYRKRKSTRRKNKNRRTRRRYH